MTSDELDWRFPLNLNDTDGWPVTGSDGLRLGHLVRVRTLKQVAEALRGRWVSGFEDCRRCQDFLDFADDLDRLAER